MRRIVGRATVLMGLMAVTLPGCPAQADQLFAPTSFRNTPLPANAPLASGSASQVAELYSQIQSAQAPKASINTIGYSTPVYTVDGAQPTRQVMADDPSCVYGNPCLPEQWRAVPLPSNAQPAAGTDGNLVVYQPSTDTLWEFWQFRWVNGVPHAAYGGRMPNVSANPGYFSDPSPGSQFGASGTSIAELTGLQRISELQAGVINHAVGVVIPRPASGFVWPAQRQDGWINSLSQDPLAPHEGAVLRLPASLNIDALGMPPYATMLAKAIQKYGMVVQDSSRSHLTFPAEDPSPIMAQNGGCNPYGSSCQPGIPAIFQGGVPDDTGQLKNFPWLQLQVVAMPVGGF